MKQYNEGIYFGMPEDEYHAIPYFSRSLAESINFDVEEAWYNSHHNPSKPEKKSIFMDLGKAVHSLILEPETFENLYIKKPRYSDFPGRTILDTNDELKEFLSSVGEKKSGNKDDLIARAEPYINVQTHLIWAHEIAKFQEQIEIHDKRELSQDHAFILDGIKTNLDRTKVVKKIFQNGCSEITIILKDPETGVMCKFRIDYARIEAIGELKTFSMKYKRNLQKYMNDTINFERYNVQFAVYQEALFNIINKIKNNEAEVFGEIDSEWLTKFLERPRKKFFIVFARTEAPFQIRSKELKKSESDHGSDNVYFTEGLRSFRTALVKYLNLLEEFGDQPWTEGKEITTLRDEDVPNVLYQNQYLD